MQETINRLIIIAFSWNQTGQTNDLLKKQFKSLMNELASKSNTDFEGAMKILLASQIERSESHGPSVIGQHGH